MSLGYRWLNYVQESVIAPDIVVLDGRVTDSLLRLTKKLKEEDGGKSRGRSARLITSEYQKARRGQSATCTSQLEALRASDFRGPFIARRS